MQRDGRPVRAWLLVALLVAAAVGAPVAAAPTAGVDGSAATVANGPETVGIDAPATTGPGGPAAGAAEPTTDRVTDAGAAHAALEGPTHGVVDARGDGWAASSGTRDAKRRDRDGARSAPDAPTAPAAARSTGTIRLTNTLRRVEADGEYGATSRFEIPDEVTSVETTLPAAATDVEADGFSRTDDGTWEWDGTTERPTLTYRMPANRTIDRDDPLSGPGNYVFVDAGAWAIVQPPSLGARWSWSGGGQVRLARENAAAEGVATRGMAYLGPYEEYARDANGQRVRLVVPAAADLAASPEAVLDDVGYAAGAMQVGDRDPEVVLIAAPTDGVDWGVRGLQTGPATAWVRDRERLDTADNVWLHEYVHTRQGFRTAASAAWLIEATATYYAALLALERGHIGFDTFREVLRRGESDPQADSVLAEPGSWRNHAPYTKGALVAGELDRRLRLATDGERTLATVVRDLNGHDGEVTGTVLRDRATDAGGSSVGDRTERLTTTSDVPDAWGREAHDDAFGTLPARIGYSLAGEEAVRVAGDYREGAIAAERRDPIALVTGETLVLGVTVHNTGGTAGEYDLALSVDGEPEATRTGRLAAGENATETLSRRFDEPGEYEVAVADRRFTVVVSEPAEPTVTDVSVEPNAVTAGESVVVSLSVANDAPIPAHGAYEVTVDGETVTTETVRLDAGAETTVAVTVPLDAPGERVIAAGGERVAVDVAAETTPTGGETSGFGIVAAVVGLSLGAALYRRRRD